MNGINQSLCLIAFITDPAGPTTLQLAVTREAEGTEPQTEEFPLDPGFVQEVLKLTDRAEQEPHRS